MLKTIYNWIIFALSAIGALLVFSGVGGSETESVSFTGGIYISLIGFVIIAAVVYRCNRNKKFPLTFSDNLKILRKRGF